MSALPTPLTAVSAPFAPLDDEPTAAEIEAGADALADYRIRSRTYDTYDDKGAAEVVLYAALEARRNAA